MTKKQSSTEIPVLVVTAVDWDGEFVEFIIIAPDGKVSPVTRLEHGSHGASSIELRNCNPYGVYGDAIADFLGVDKYDVSISVFNNHSGNLEKWKEWHSAD